MKQPDPVVECVANALFESVKCSDHAWMEQHAATLACVDVDGEVDFYAAARAAIDAIMKADVSTETIAPVRSRPPPPGMRVHVFDIQWRWNWARCRFCAGRKAWYATHDSTEHFTAIRQEWEWL